jgi:spore coat protein U-like protein
MQSRVTRIGRSLFAGLMLTIASAHGAITCNVTSLPALSFGSYDPFAASPLDVTTAAVITCTTNKQQGESVAITTSLTRGGGPSYSPRQMRNALNNPLNYNLYADTLRTTIFGDGSAGTSTRSLSGTPTKNVAVVFTDNIFGRIFAGQDVSVGSYSDTLIYTISY